MSRRARLLALSTAATAALFSIESLLPDPFAGPPWHARLVAIGSLAKLTLQSAGVALAWTVAARFDLHSRARAAWSWLGGGIVLLLAGQATLVPRQVFGAPRQPAPAPSDIFFLTSFLPLLAALLAFADAYHEAGLPVGTPAQRWRRLLALLAVAALPAAFVLAPLAWADDAPVQKAIRLGYPLLDLAVLAPTLLLLHTALRFGGQLHRVWLALLGGLFALTVGDLLGAYVSQRGWTRLEPLIDTAFVAGYGLLALGALLQLDLLRPWVPDDARV